MRGILGVLCCSLATASASLGAEAPLPPSVAHPFVQPAAPYRPVPVADEQAHSHAPAHPSAHPSAHASGHEFAPEFAHGSIGGRRRDGSCWQRLRGWLTYRAAPVPRECKCHRECVGGPAPLYSYFALRYPHAGHGYHPGHSHDSPFVAGSAEFTAPQHP